MSLDTLIKGAIELGVIPMLALFLVFAMYLQNRRLTLMLERQEQNNIEVVKLLIKEVAEFGKLKLSNKGTQS